MATKKYQFRLNQEALDQIDQVAEYLKTRGLSATRTDAVKHSVAVMVDSLPKIPEKKTKKKNGRG